jgi:hypothetical protein
MRSINREVHRRQLKVKVERKKEITQRAQRVRREGIEGNRRNRKEREKRWSKDQPLQRSI